tara:strand:- start:7383 stop:7844 length:462 start_codon:yes stop_codon:yes gene_type:complete
MSFTRFHDDPNRIKKQVEESSAVGNYSLNTPGQGTDLPFMEDPQIRLQQWGSNLRTNTTNLESDLLGLTRPLNRDNLNSNDYKLNEVNSSSKYYKTAEPFVDESRLSHPAWMYKDLEQTRWEYPLTKQLNNYEIKFTNNVDSRNLEKDTYDKK